MSNVDKVSFTYFKTAFETEEFYYKAIGFREEDGKTETTDRYLERVESLMKLYGALVQVCIIYLLLKMPQFCVFGLRHG